MRKKYRFLIGITGLMLFLAAGVYAQGNTPACPINVQEAFTATELLCETLTDGQACIGNGTVATTPAGSATVQFANPGEFATLTDIQRLQTQTLSTDSQAWTSVQGKLQISRPDGTPAIADILIFGDTVMSNASEGDVSTGSSSILTATVQAGGGVIVRQEPRVDSNNIWQLVNNETVQAIGRSSDNQWVRIILPSPNGGAGWVFSQFLDVTGGAELLPFQTNDFPIPEGAGAVQVGFLPMQSFKLESLLTDRSCVDTPDSGVILQSPQPDQRVLVEVNGVELRYFGTVYLTAQVGGDMNIYLLEGNARVFIGEERTDLNTVSMTTVPMTANLAPAGSASPASPIPADIVGLIDFLPLRLLSRGFDTSGTAVVPADTPVEETPPEESAPEQVEEPPAPTEAPPAVTIDPELCPTLVEESYTATELLCSSISANQACLGNSGENMVQTIPRREIDGFAFVTPGDIVTSTDLQSIYTSVFPDANNTWTSIYITVDVPTTSGASASANIVLFGEVILDNVGEDPTEETATDVTEPVEQTAPTTSETTDTATTVTGDGVTATIEAPGGAGVIIRREPRVDTDTIGQLANGDTVSALGRSVDQQWVQIQDSTGVVGWVFQQVLVVEGGPESLPIIDPAEASSTAAQQQAPPPVTGNSSTATTSGDTPEFTSMQAFNFTSEGVPSDCGTASGGIMIQSPDGLGTDRIVVMVNGVRFELNGTVYLRASVNENMNVIGLEGDVHLTAMDDTQTVNAGQQATIEMDNNLAPTTPPSIPGDYNYSTGERLVFLPIRLLPRSFQVIVPDPPPGEEVVQSPTNNDSDDSDSSSNSSDDDEIYNIGGILVNFNANCTMSSGDRRRNLRANAGAEFDVINVLEPGQTIDASTQKRGSDGIYWYETARGWIRSDAGIPAGDCEHMPLTGVIYDLGNGTTTSGPNTVVVEPVAPAAPTGAQPTPPPPPPNVSSDAFGDVCKSGGFAVSAEIENSGANYIEFGGVWTGQAGKTATFTAEIPYFRAELLNILTFVNEDGSPWLGSTDNRTFTITFDSNRRFRVRVAALLGDFVTLRVNC